MTRPPLTVACVLRSGGDFRPEHVSALHAGVMHWWPAGTPVRFVVLTDRLQPKTPGVTWQFVPGMRAKWWAKMELFAAQQDALGDILYFDLDTMVVGDLTEIVHAAVSSDCPILLRDFYHPERAQSGMMYLPHRWRPAVYAAWMECCATPAKDQFRGDGEFLHSVWHTVAARWQDLLPHQVVSYKVHVRQRMDRGQELPEAARVVCFHGIPRPWTSRLWALRTTASV